MAKKPQKIIVLRVPKEKLAAIAGIPLPTQATTPSSAPQSPAPTPGDTTALKHSDSADQASESNATPAPGADASTPNGKKGKGSAATAKRAIGQTNGDSRPRGKPGPKKKPRNDDGTIDHTNNPTTTTITTTTTTTTSRPAGTGGAHKLNPKTNAGAINANLRALDRSGKPCRRWERKGFSVKSFTGISWDMPSWKGGENPKVINGDDSSDVRDISLNSSSEMKPDNNSDVVMSNTGDAPMESAADAMAMSTPAASSPPPAPTPAPPALVAAQG